MIKNNELKKSYPKAYKMLSEWALKYLKIFAKNMNIPDEDAKGLEGMADQAVEGFVLIQPRLLYDFFDEKELYISIIYDSVEAWDWTIDPNEEGSTRPLEGYKTRQLAEEAAFLEAFDILEKL